MEDMTGFMPNEEMGTPQMNVKAVRKRFSKLGWMYVIGTIVIFAVQLVPTILIGFLKPEWLWDGNISMLISVVPMYLVGMPVLILLVRTIPGDTPERHRMKPGQFIVAAIMCFALMYAFNLLGTILTNIIGMLKGGIVQNEIANVAESLSLGVIFFYMVLCAPIMEEYVFRKLIVDRSVRYGQGIAVLLSGLMFGLFHGNLNQFVYAFALGVFLAYLYVRTGNLKITIALHMMVNFMGGFVSSWLMRTVDLEAYLEASMEGMDAMMDFVTANLSGMLGYMVYLVLVYGMMIAGVILLIVFLAMKKFAFAPAMEPLPKGKKFSTVILNAGMIVYCVFWIVMIIWQLFQ